MRISDPAALHDDERPIALFVAARLLAFGAFVPIGSDLTGILLGRLRIRLCLVITSGACLQVVGTALLSRSSFKYETHEAQYAYKILIDLDLEFLMPTPIYVLRFTVEKRDLGKNSHTSSCNHNLCNAVVETTAVGQFRILGGLVAVSIGASITMHYSTRHLGEMLPPQLLGLILKRTEKIHLLQDDVALAAREVFGEAYNLQIDLATGFVVAQLPSTAMMWTAQNYLRLDQDNMLEN